MKNKTYNKGAVHLLLCIAAVSLLFGCSSPQNKSAANISYNESMDTYYINNAVVVYFSDGCEKSDVDSIVELLDGEVVSSAPAIDMYEIRISPRSYEELETLCEELLEHECVEDAFIDLAIKIDEN